MTRRCAREPRRSGPVVPAAGFPRRVAAAANGRRASTTSPGLPWGHVGRWRATQRVKAVGRSPSPACPAWATERRAGGTSRRRPAAGRGRSTHPGSPSAPARTAPTGGAVSVPRRGVATRAKRPQGAAGARRDKEERGAGGTPHAPRAGPGMPPVPRARGLPSAHAWCGNGTRAVARRPVAAAPVTPGTKASLSAAGATGLQVPKRPRRAGSRGVRCPGSTPNSSSRGATPDLTGRAAPVAAPQAQGVALVRPHLPRTRPPGLHGSSTGRALRSVRPVRLAHIDRLTGQHNLWPHAGAQRGHPCSHRRLDRLAGGWRMLPSPCLEPGPHRCTHVPPTARKINRRRGQGQLLSEG
jgi:hypothetical protein